MAITLFEMADSRMLDVAQQGASFTGTILAFGSSDEAEIYEAVVLNTTLSYFGTLFRTSVSVKPRGHPLYWDVTVTYTAVPQSQALTTPNLNPGGTVTEPPTPPPTPPADQALGPGYSFTSIGGTTRIYQALETLQTVRSVEAIAAGRPAKDHHGAIGVTKEGVEGIDVVTRNSEFQIEVRQAGVTVNFIRGVSALTGTVNSADWYGFKAGEVLYLGAEGRYAAGQLWQITHKFAFEPNRAAGLVVARDGNGVAQITLAQAKQGWDYLDVEYYEKHDGAAGRVLRPEQARVLRVYERANFLALGIGG